MKKGFLFACVTFISSLLFCQQIKEKVLVTNVELVVRVMRDGAPVGGLSKGDFHLFENGKEKEINGFFEKRRRIGNLHEELSISSADLPKRVFLFYFWSRERLRKIQRQALDYFFDNFFRPGDEAYIYGLNAPVVIRNPESAKDSVKIFFKQMNKTRTRFTSEIQARYMSQLTAEYQEETLYHYYEMFRMPSPDAAILHNQYHFSQVSPSDSSNNRYIMQNMSNLKVLARNLKPIQKEKWAFVFLTLDPLIRKGEWVFSAGQPGGIAEVQEEFVQSQATFNLLLFNSSLLQMTKELIMPVFAIPMTGDNISDAFSKISRATGGEVSSGTRFEKSLDRSSEKEDVYYILTYSPDDGPVQESKIDIRTDVKGARVLHKSRISLAEIRGISIDHVSFHKSQLSLTVNGYERSPFQGNETGRLKLNLEAVPVEGKPLTYEKEIIVSESQMNITLKLNFPSKGAYMLRLDAEDLLSGKKASETLDIVVE